MRYRVVLFSLLPLMSCAEAGPPSLDTTGVSEAETDLRERALLLMMSDRRVFETFAIVEMGSKPEVDIREALAVSLGRIGDPRGRPELEVMLAGPHERIRRAAAFSLGQLASPESRPVLTGALLDIDLETAIWSVEALARTGADLGDVLGAIEGASADEVWPRLLPYLFRFPNEQSIGVARQALTLSDRDLRAMAAYAMARNPLLQGAPSLRSLLDDPDPWIRGWAARSLGEVGSGRDLAALGELLNDSRPGPIIQALRSAQRLISSGRAAPPDGWRPRLLELMNDSRAGVAITAIAVSSSWLLDEEISGELNATVETGTPYFREVSLIALAQGGDPRGFDFAYSFALAADPSLRALAAKCLSFNDDSALLEKLFADIDAEVRLAALEALLGIEDGPGSSLVSAALADSDPAVVGTALAWLAENPVLPTEDISRALAAQALPELIEVRLNATRALLARGQSEPLERGLVVRNLESLAEIGDFPARRAAADALVELGRVRPPVAPAQTRKTVSSYEDILLLMNEPREVEIKTRYGALRVRLQCGVTPMSCLNFLQLADQGFYEDLAFHRVVPDFVVQGGDPRGDGWGGPGYTIRDELNRLPFDRGVIGMASAGPDTAGSQFFITLSRQPHLDGRYTAFGEVVEGLDLLDSIVQGDRMSAVREIR